MKTAEVMPTNEHTEVSPSPVAKKPAVHPLYFVILGIAVVVLGVVYFAPEKFFLSKLKFPSWGKKSPQIAIVVTPTPPTPTPRPIPHGPKGFTVGQADKTVPQFGKGTVDPYDPTKGATQTVTIKVQHTQPVTKVTATIKTDHDISKPYELKLISGTSIDGQWEGSWQVDDSYLYTYAIVLKAVSNKSASVEITLR